LILLALVLSSPVYAGKKKGRLHVAASGARAKPARGKRVFVPGYVKKDGTYVFPRFRVVTRN
jgi:hypothetical protein